MLLACVCLFQTPIVASLLKLPTEQMNKVAVDCFYCIQQFMGDQPLRSTQTDVDCAFQILKVRQLPSWFGSFTATAARVGSCSVFMFKLFETSRLCSFFSLTHMLNCRRHLQIYSPIIIENPMLTAAIVWWISGWIISPALPYARLVRLCYHGYRTSQNSCCPSVRKLTNH